MKLYHGTAKKNLESILQGGIVPRTDEGNWEHTVASNPDCVYLTTTYAGYFAACAAKGTDDNWIIVEVDTDFLDEDNFRPDEDYVAQSIEYLMKQDSNSGNWFFLAFVGLTLNEITAKVRDRIDDFKSDWMHSVEGMGNCCYIGAIPLCAITRITEFNPDSNSKIVMDALDPSISVINHMVKGDHYKALTKWLMGEKVTVDEYRGDLETKADVIYPDQEHVVKTKAYIQEALDKQEIKVIYP